MCCIKSPFSIPADVANLSSMYFLIAAKIHLKNGRTGTGYLDEFFKHAQSKHPRDSASQQACVNGSAHV
jgi:hypothetical protein